MGVFYDIFKKLLPTGRAYKFGNNGNNLIQGNADEFDRVRLDIDKTQNSVIPDNADFDLERYERFYDIQYNPLDSHAVRMARVRARMTPVNPDVCLLNIAELQSEIDNAGWGGVLYLHENPMGLMPWQVLQPLNPPTQFGNYQFGQFQFNGYNVWDDYPEFYSSYQFGTYQFGNAQFNSQMKFNNNIANSLNRHYDSFVNLVPLAHTFFVCGPNLGDVVTLPQSDEQQLRQLLLNIKPATAVGFLLIKYI